MTAASDCESQLLDVLGRIVRRLTRLSGGLDEGPALTATQRVALIETFEAAEPIRLHDLAERAPRRLSMRDGRLVGVVAAV